MSLMLFIISALPVFLLGMYIYKKDRNKEPGKLLLKLFLAGMLSCILVLIISYIMELIFPILGSDTEDLNLFELIIYVFIGVALVEEGCKWLMVYLFSYNSKEFDEIYDMIVYSVFVALGFAFFENLLYVYGGGLTTGIARAFLAVPGHACDGIFMGYYLGLSKLTMLNSNKKLSKKYMVLSIIVPIILHGIYDYCVFSGYTLFLMLFFIFIISLYVFASKKVKRFSNIKRKMVYKNNYCTICGHVVDSDYCPICGNKNE